MDAGWQLLEQGSADVSIWSSWSMFDESGNEWVGFVLVHSIGKTDTKNISIRVDLVHEKITYQK